MRNSHKAITSALMIFWEKTMKAIAVLAFAALAAGCWENTGMVFVDYDTAFENGIAITNFVDTPMYATIWYDYSAIKDFSPTNLEVMVVKRVIDKETWNDPKTDWSKFSERTINLQKKLMTLYDVNGYPVIDNPPKKAIIKENVPGKLKIFCLDDIGAYQIKYKK